MVSPSTNSKRRDIGLRPLGWAGLLADVPASFHPITIRGAASRGMISLADGEHARLELSWSTVTARRFKPDPFLRKKIQRADPRAPALIFETLDNPAFAPMIVAREASGEVTRAAGYCPATRRVVECVYRHGPTRENEAVLGVTLPGLRDQPFDAPSRWAFFDVSFVAPPRFAYQRAVLNLGDMRVSLVAGRDELSGPALTIRQLYPATLALQRQPLERWHSDWLLQHRKTHRVEGLRALGRGVAGVEEVKTLRGPALVSRATARGVIRLFHWWMSRHAAYHTIYDPEADRLINIFITGERDRLGAVVDEVISGLHWAMSSG